LRGFCGDVWLVLFLGGGCVALVIVGCCDFLFGLLGGRVGGVLVFGGEGGGGVGTVGLYFALVGMRRFVGGCGVVGGVFVGFVELGFVGGCLFWVVGGGFVVFWFLWFGWFFVGWGMCVG